MIYEQGTGRLFADDGELLGEGYSGSGEGKNNPQMQEVKDIGPLPVGVYTVGPAYHHPKLGPYTMNLTPDPEDEMYGRADFRIHGDNSTHTASEGCIIQPLQTRVEVNARDDKRLHVVAGV